MSIETVDHTFSGSYFASAKPQRPWTERAPPEGCRSKDVHFFGCALARIAMDRHAEAPKYSRVCDGYHREAMIGVHKKSSRADERIGMQKARH